MTKKIYLQTLKKCPRSLYFPLLIFMTGHKTDRNITEKLNSTCTKEHKTEYNYTLVEQHFYDRTQNRIQLHFGEPQNS